MNVKTKKRKGKKIITAVIVLSLLALLLLPRLLGNRRSNYDETTLVQGDITTYYSFAGSVEAKSRTTVFAEKIMQVSEFMVKEGQSVKKDDVLMKTSMGEQIKAKIGGEVSKIYIEENAQLMSGSKLMDIVDYQNLQLKVQVDEYDLPAMEEGKEVDVTIHALSKDIKGTISEVSKEGIYQNGVTFFTAIISIENDDEIKIGMSAEAKVLNERAENVQMLSMDALQFDNNNNPYVYIKGDKRLPSQSEVVLGINDGVNVEIKSGINPEDIVLTPQSEQNRGFRPRAMEGNRDNDDNGGN